MGRPMTYWADNGGYWRYIQGVYNQGTAVLLEAGARPSPASHKCWTCSERLAPLPTISGSRLPTIE